MKRDSQSLVSVITPVYNGEKHLAECIESIICQTYKNWEYVIVNNGSTDRTLKIAQSYAAKDSRIRVHNNEQFLDLMPNWNHSVRQMSAQSEYCKIVHADDLLFPDCLTLMVKLAEDNPSIDVVSAYRLIDRSVWGPGIPYNRQVFSGREICRLTFLNGLRVFGSPTTTLIRSRVIRSRKKFYNETNLHADREIIFDILRDADFAFIHQVLTYTRVHDESVSSSFATRYNTYIPGEILNLRKYGHFYLNEQEWKECYNEVSKRYYRFLGRSLLRGREKKFWEYHKNSMKDIGDELKLPRVLGAASLIIIDALLNPKLTIEKLMRLQRKQTNRTNSKRILGGPKP